MAEPDPNVVVLFDALHRALKDASLASRKLGNGIPDGKLRQLREHVLAARQLSGDLRYKHVRKGM